MSRVGSGTTNVTTSETALLEYRDGGVYMAYLDGFALEGGENLTARVYSRVNQDSEIRLYTSGTLAGAAPADPSILELGPVVSSELVDLRGELDGGDVDLPWRVEQVGRVSTVPDGEGSQTAVIATPHTLVTVPFGGTFVLQVDVAAMQAGDDLKLRLQSKTVDGGTIRTTKYVLLEDVQTNGIYTLGPIVCHDSVVAILEESAGVGRIFPWKVLRLA